MKPSEYIITAGEFRHLPSLANVEQQAAALFPPGSIPDSIRGDSVPVALLEEAVREKALWVALAKDASSVDDGGPSPLGFALLRFPAGYALLAELDVLPAWTRRGIGRALIARTAEAAARRGHDALYLTTFTHVPWNAPFYARLGFRPLDAQEMPDTLRDILEEERAAGLMHRIAMRRALP